MEKARQPSDFHAPVLVDRVPEFLLTNPSGIYVDGTVGGGGHARMILERLNDRGLLIGIDRDEEAIAYSEDRLSGYGKKAKLVCGDFENVDTFLEKVGVDEIDGLLLDLGVSSHQLDEPERGFSYMADGPLDMRMGDTEARACDILRSISERDLADVLYRYGEERHSRKIAREIVRVRARKSIETTGALAGVVRRITPPRWQTKTLSRVFQALRITVNRELEQLANGLERVYPLLKRGGRIVVITYHSLEDRLVKRFFRGETPSYAKHGPVIPVPLRSFNILTRRVVTPSEEEMRENSRSRSAKLRAAEKIG